MLSSNFISFFIKTLAGSNRITKDPMNLGPSYLYSGTSGESEKVVAVK
jgi:hypothetical protein